MCKYSYKLDYRRAIRNKKKIIFLQKYSNTPEKSSTINNKKLQGLENTNIINNFNSLYVKDFEICQIAKNKTKRMHI